MRNKHIPLVMTMIALIVFLAMAGRAFALAQRKAEGNLAREPRLSQSQKARPVTLLQAWEMLNAHAQKWQSGAKVVWLVSVDHPDDSPSAGQDGRRRAWQAVILSDSVPNTELWVTLVDGLIAEESKVEDSAFDGNTPSAVSEAASLPGRLIDSPQALKHALTARPELGPDNGKGRGFHFTLESSPPSGAPVITVRGVYNDMPAIVSLDAATGALVAARSLGFGSGGILYSYDLGKTWHASNLTGRMVNAIIADPLAENQAYAVTTQDERITVYQTQDGGHSWAFVGSLPEAAGDWPFDLEAAVEPSGSVRLLVGTASGLWSSTNGRDWSILAGLPDGPKQWLAAIHAPTSRRVLVSITAGANRGLYASTNLVDWRELTKDVLRLSKSFDRRTVLATNEQSASPAFLLSVDGETKIEGIGPVLRAVGDFTDPNSTVLQSPLSGTGLWSGQTSMWTLDVPVASLAVAPDFPASRVVVAGGFRSGIYRSNDAGRTWERVLADPSSVVQGNGEVFDVAFLSSDTLIAINGGEMIWRDF